MDKLLAMNVFVQIAEKGSLTAAAASMDKSLPAVVRILASLEETLQVRLFNRTTRRIVLTEEGKLYLEQCRKILSDIQEAERALGQSQNEPSGTITVTAPVGFGQMYVAPAIIRFLRQYPKTNVKLLLLDRVVDILEEGVDVAVRIAHLADSSLIAKSIAAIQQVTCASSSLLQRVGTPRHPSELSGLPCVCFTSISNLKEWDYLDNGKPISVPINSVLTCNQVMASVNACESGLGFGRFYSYQVDPYIKQGKLTTVLSDYYFSPLPLSLVYPHTRLLSTRVRIMVDWLTEEINRSLPNKGFLPT